MAAIKRGVPLKVKKGSIKRSKMKKKKRNKKLAIGAGKRGSGKITYKKAAKNGGKRKSKSGKKKKKKRTHYKNHKRCSMKRLSKILPFLQTFKELRPSQRGIMLAHLDDSSCKILQETIANVLRNPSVSESRKKKLRKVLQPHKSALRNLARGSSSGGAKKKTLYKIGGLPLAAILSTAIPILLDVIRSRKK